MEQLLKRPAATGVKDDYRYLKPNVVLEPLFARWYAWPHLISPATAARNVTGRHLKIMNSYIQAPNVHAAAARNPAMLGGPFMDYEGNRVEDVKKLRDYTLQEQKHLIELSQAIDELQALLKRAPAGYSLEPLYPLVPDVLKGYVELIYDLNNNPSFRFFEYLLYKSKYYSNAFQSIALWSTHNDERPFVLSTPKLATGEVVHVDVPFCHPVIDELAKMKRTANDVDLIRQALPAGKCNEAVFDSFFTDEPPVPYQKYDGDRIRMRYFGHACILIETKDVCILVDPLVSYYGYQRDVSRFSDMDLPDTIDFILITHNHQDHILFETLLPLRHKTKTIVVPRTTGGNLQDPNVKLMLEHAGFNQVVEVGEMEGIRFENCTITGIPFIGEHSDLNIQSKMCYHVRLGRFSILFVADSCNVEPRLYNHIHACTGDVDVVFLGMECDGAPLSWLYGPLLTEPLPRDMDYSRRLSGSNYERGMALVDSFNPKEVYVYAMGQEPWLTFISSIKYTPESNPIVASDKLVAHCRSKGMVAERLFGEKELLYHL